MAPVVLYPAEPWPPLGMAGTALLAPQVPDVQGLGV